MKLDWLTNDPKAAKAFRQADAQYDRDRAAAKHLPLAKKVEALRIAKTRYAEARRKIMNSTEEAR